MDYAGLEKATGAPKGDKRSDIFFLGVVFYELLTGEHPLGERENRSRTMTVRFDSIAPLSQRDDVPGDLARLIDKMLAYKPAGRYQDYETLLADLNRVQLTVEPPPMATAATGPQPPRVAIVHHSPKIQEILKGKLSRRGFQTVLTTDIGRAAALCKLKPVDCIIVDLDTTGRDGIDQYKAMKRSGSAKTAVFLAEPEQTPWCEGVDVESTMMLNKPLLLGPVYKAVRFLVDRATQPQTLA